MNIYYSRHSSRHLRRHINNPQLFTVRYSLYQLYIMVVRQKWDPGCGETVQVSGYHWLSGTYGQEHTPICNLILTDFKMISKQAVFSPYFTSSRINNDSSVTIVTIIDRSNLRTHFNWKSIIFKRNPNQTLYAK